MGRIERDEARERRITMEIIVDTYGPEEQALGWYCYLEDNVYFPFRARCAREEKLSPLRAGEEVEVEGLAPEDDCMHEMFVMIHWCDREIGVPLAQLEAIEADSEMEEAIGDWQYWVARGRQFG